MKRLLLFLPLVCLALLSFAQNGNFDGGNVWDHISYYETKDSTMHAYSSNFQCGYSHLAFTQRVNDSAFLTCFKNQDGSYTFQKINDEFKVIKSVRIDSLFSNIVDVKVQGGIVCIADNKSTGATLNVLEITSLFGGITISSSVGVTFPSLYTYVMPIQRIQKLEIVSVVNTSYGNQNGCMINLAMIGDDHIVMKASVLKGIMGQNETYTIAFVYHNMVNEYCYDLSVCGGNVYAVSGVGSNGLVVRKFDFNKTNFDNLIARKIEYDSTLLLYSVYIDNVYNGNVAVVYSQYNGSDVSKDVVTFFDTTLNNSTSYYFNSLDKPALLNAKYCVYDTSLFISRYNVNGINVLEKLKFTNYNNVPLHVPTRDYMAYEHAGYGKIDFLNNRFFVTLSLEQSTLHYVKGAYNFSKYNDACDTMLVDTLHTCYAPVYTDTLVTQSIKSSNINFMTKNVLSLEKRYDTLSYSCLPKIALSDRDMVVPPNGVESIKTKGDSVQSNNIGIFPNPSVDIITITSDACPIKMIEIMNDKGEIIKRFDDLEYLEYQVDLKSIQIVQPTVFVKVYTIGGDVTVKKIIKL